MPKGTLNAALNRLTEDVSTRVSGKRKLEDEDSVAVDNGVELFGDIFRRFVMESDLTPGPLVQHAEFTGRLRDKTICPGLVSGPSLKVDNL
jgi:hypothetical protein